MIATHILFVAWQNASEKNAQAEAWKKVGNADKSKEGARNYEVVVYKPDCKSENLKKIQTGYIYILGHGAAGYGNIADIDENGAIELSAAEVANRLIDSGLSTAFSGKIKCFNCNSSAEGNGKPAFAKIFADEMRKRKYSNCQYFGYNRSIVAAYGNMGFDGMYKHAVIELEGRYIAISRAGETKDKIL